MSTSDDREHVQNLLAQVARRSDAAPVVEAAGAALARGDLGFVTELGLALAARCTALRATDPRAAAQLDAFQRLFELTTAAPGPEHAALALSLLAMLPPDTRRRSRHQASVLAAGRPAADLTAAFTGPAAERLRLSLVRELELRGTDPAGIPEIAAWLEHRRRNRRPLHLATAQDASSLPRFDAPARELYLGPNDGGPLPPVGPAAPRPPVEEVTERETADALGSATACWSNGSNGRTEARVFRFRAPLAVPGTAVTPDLLRTVLPGLALDCLDRSGSSRNNRKRPRRPVGLAVRVVEAEQVWHLLHAAATGGGAYSRGLDEASGRLAAWRSLAALAGCPGTATVDEVELAADDHLWFVFESDGPWFDRVVWDLGVLSLAPDLRRLTVLAATDTD
ncbi:DUF6183 family protein [Kitasatospora sp. NPDC057198]|uniref:DUF6183 family protein n=1 Tax=Kitasatospora sp. NPDC057198 TaxID=3346046 RepID=UPI0036328EDE